MPAPKKSYLYSNRIRVTLPSTRQLSRSRWVDPPPLLQACVPVSCLPGFLLCSGSREWSGPRPSPGPSAGTCAECSPHGPNPCADHTPAPAFQLRPRASGAAECSEQREGLPHSSGGTGSKLGLPSRGLWSIPRPGAREGPPYLPQQLGSPACAWWPPCLSPCSRGFSVSVSSPR